MQMAGYDVAAIDALRNNEALGKNALPHIMDMVVSTTSGKPANEFWRRSWAVANEFPDAEPDTFYYDLETGFQICVDGLAPEALRVLTDPADPKAKSLHCPGICTSEQQMLCTGLDAWILGDSMASFRNSKSHVYPDQIFSALQGTEFVWEFFGKQHVDAAKAGAKHRWLMQVWSQGLGAKAKDITATLQRGVAEIAAGQRHAPSMTIITVAVNDLRDGAWRHKGLTAEVERDWEEMCMQAKSMGRVAICMALDSDTLFPPKGGPDGCALDLSVLARKARDLGLYVIDLCKFSKIYDMDKAKDGWHFCYNSQELLHRGGNVLDRRALPDGRVPPRVWTGAAQSYVFPEATTPDVPVRCHECAGV